MSANTHSSSNLPRTPVDDRIQDQTGTPHPNGAVVGHNARHLSSVYPGSMHRSQPDCEGVDEQEVSSDLPALQVYDNLDGAAELEPLADDDPTSFDLVAPPQGGKSEYSLEKRSQVLFSREHLQVIFADSALLFKFTAFLAEYRPQAVPTLVYYLDALKAIRALHYANAICEALDPIEGLGFTNQRPDKSSNASLEQKANSAFDALVREELPAYITHLYIQLVSLSVTRRVTGSLAPHLQDASEGLAEVFCLTDPSRPDNPIVFASEGKISGHWLSAVAHSVQNSTGRHSME